MDVPRPVSGHWEMLRLGQMVEQVPLPEAQAGVAVEFLLRPKGTLSEEESPPLPEAPRAEEAKAAKVTETDRQIAGTAVEPVRNRGAVSITRQELYEKVWQMSLKQLANEWGTSYVQLVAACEVMNVPRPPGGHWVRLSLGLPVEKIQLPDAGLGTPTEVTLEPTLSRALRAAKSAAERQAKATVAGTSGPSGVEDVTPNAGSEEQPEKAAGGEPQAAKQTANVQPVGKDLDPIRVELPPEGAELHPIVERHMQALQIAKPGELGFVSIRSPDLSECDMTPALVPRFGRAMHALVCELEHRGYNFEEGENDGEGLGIVRDGGKVHVRWSEGTIDLEREPTNVDKRRPSWTWSLKETKATGKLALEVNASGLKGKRKWKEGDGRSLEVIVGVVVEKVEATFRWFGEQRKREAELARQQKEAAQLRLDEATREAERQAKLEEERRARERIRRHEAKLEQIAELRRQNLLVAAKLWIQSRGVAAYVAYCEATWRVAAGGALTQAQADWLTWAKAAAAGMGPFGKGYPVLERDGKLDVTTIPVGGPYPEPTELEELGEVEPKQPAAEPEVRYVEVPRQREQFPFWYLHRKH
ncbi:MAG TPA: hypothetical protein VMH30_13770 [Verrucomicrobiae bacterium]|nr:hypothetical protein [Verrucomicrobiae bacterium]